MKIDTDTLIQLHDQLQFKQEKLGNWNRFIQKIAEIFSLKKYPAPEELSDAFQLLGSEVEIMNQIKTHHREMTNIFDIRDWSKRLFNTGEDDVEDIWIKCAVSVDPVYSTDFDNECRMIYFLILQTRQSRVNNVLQPAINTVMSNENYDKFTITNIDPYSNTVDILYQEKWDLDTVFSKVQDETRVNIFDYIESMRQKIDDGQLPIADLWTVLLRYHQEIGPNEAVTTRRTLNRLAGIDDINPAKYMEEHIGETLKTDEWTITILDVDSYNKAVIVQVHDTISITQAFKEINLANK